MNNPTKRKISMTKKPGEGPGSRPPEKELQPDPSEQELKLWTPEQEVLDLDKQEFPILLDRLMVRKSYQDPDGALALDSEPESPEESYGHWEFDFGWPSDNKPKGQVREERVRVIAVLGKPTENPECRELLLKVFDWNRIEQVLKGYTPVTDIEPAPNKKRTRR